MREHEVTVVMRSHNDADLLPCTLAALDAQEGVRWRLIVFESASADGSPAILARFGRGRIEHLAPGTYHSSRVLNRGCELADTELVAFLNSDAIMLDASVLRRLADAIVAEERCAGAYARQVPRPDAGAMTRLDHHVAFDRRGELQDMDAGISLVCSMIRRSAWEAVPFDPALTYAEDCVWTRRVRERGWRVAYVDEARVEHSHEYDAEQRYRRAYGDAAALAVIADRRPPDDPVRGALLPWACRCARDAWRLVRMGRPLDCWRLPAHRWPQMLGRWRGLRDGWRCFREPGDGRTTALQPVAAGRSTSQRVAAPGVGGHPGGDRRG